MPTDLPNHGNPGPGNRRIQAMLLTDALATDDAFIVSRVLNEIAVQQGKEDSFGENPTLSVFLSTIAMLGLDVSAKARE